MLVRGGELVALTGINARARGIVQVGGVYTPPALRRNGYARAAVAASLLGERERGAIRSTLLSEKYAATGAVTADDIAAHVRFANDSACWAIHYATLRVLGRKPAS